MNTLEPSSLRIGNYIKNDGVVVKADGRTIFDIWGGTKKKYEPIELTEDWLIRLGFDKQEKGSVSYQFTIGENPLTKDWLFDLIWLKELDKEINKKLEPHPFYKNGYQKVKTVHQLQNLYHALLGEELACSP